MKITPRLTLLFLGLSLVPMGLLGLEYYRSGKAALRAEVMDHLAATARHLEEQVDQEFRQNQAKLELVVSGRGLAGSLEAYLDNGLETSRKRIQEIVDTIQVKVPEFESFAILDTLGRSILVPDSLSGGVRAIQEEAFRLGHHRGPSDLWTPSEKGLSLYLSSPIHYQGRYLGVAVVRVEGLELNRMVEYPRQSGWDVEPFLVSMGADSSMIFVFPPGEEIGDALDFNASLDRNLVSARLLDSRRDTIFTDLVDYRGIPVLAAVRFVESAGWGLIVRVDQRQAFASIHQFRTHTLWAMAAASLLSLICSLVVSRRLTRPILRLARLARQFSAGNLASRDPVDTKDELGDLGSSLTAMAENLDQSRHRLEDMVAARTRELQKEIEERKRAEAEMASARRDLQEYIDQMSTLSIKLDLEGRVLMANQASITASGLSKEYLLGKNFLKGPWHDFDSAVVGRMRMSFLEARSGKIVNRNEAFLLENKLVHINVTMVPVKDDRGEVAYIICEGRDITALKYAQEALYDVNEGLEESVRERTESLRAALKEKDMLLREVHHRVKNNLQIISSLLSLQSVHVRDPQVAGILMESRNRVKSMAMVHERLYAGDDLGRVGFGGYVRDLAAQLLRSSEADAHGVVLRMELEEVQVGLTQAIPCGLIIHELVANALKHAFPKGHSLRGGQPTVAIRCRPLPEGGFELEVEDNGVGLPPGLDLRKSRSLGMQLVSTLIKQLKGALEIDSTGGSQFRIRVPIGEEKGVDNAN